MWQLTYILTAFRQAVWGLDLTLSANLSEGGKRLDNSYTQDSHVNLPSGASANRPATATTPRTTLMSGYIPWLDGGFETLKRGFRVIEQVYRSQRMMLLALDTLDALVYDVLRALTGAVTWDKPTPGVVTAGA